MIFQKQIRVTLGNLCFTDYLTKLIEINSSSETKAKQDTINPVTEVFSQKLLIKKCKVSILLL